MRILLVKLSSLGDVIHNLPVVWDIRKHYPDAQIDWVVDEIFVDLLKPLLTTENKKGIDRLICVPLRKWKKLAKGAHFLSIVREFKEFKKQLQDCKYDLVIDTQGLIKSAWIAAQTKLVKDGRICGIGNKTECSSYEPLAKFFYTNSIKVPYRNHAVTRGRFLAMRALEKEDVSCSKPIFYPDFFIKNLKEKLVLEEYVLCFHSTSKVSKRWNFQYWVEVGNYLSAKGLKVIFPWGNESEKQISLELAKQVSESVVPQSFNLKQAIGYILSAKAILGVDTGLTHLSAVLEKPTIEIYCDTPKWRYEGFWSEKILNLGDKGQAPSSQEVIRGLEKILDC